MTVEIQFNGHGLMTPANTYHALDLLARKLENADIDVQKHYTPINPTTKGGFDIELLSLVTLPIATNIIVLIVTQWLQQLQNQLNLIVEADLDGHKIILEKPFNDSLGALINDVAVTQSKKLRLTLR